MKSTPAPTTLPIRSVVLGMACVLVLNLRWFIPAEDTAAGATLGLAVFWCVAAVAARWFPFANDVIARRWTRADAAVSLLVGGHVLSGLLVLILGGNRHNAAILIAEWLGIAAVWSVLRDLVRVPAIRTSIWQSTLLCLTTIAIVGCWQHWIELPSMTQSLGPKFDAVRSGGAGSDAARQELSRQGVPLSEPEFTLFEKRLRDSREPFAFFALANTLGGFLAAGLMLLVGDSLLGSTTASSVVRQRAFGTRMSAATLMGVCLLLTKSRTAWLAFLLVAAGVVVIRIVGTRLRLSASRRAVGISIGALATLLVIAGVLARSGSWDREVLTEASKSLSYRVLYWDGTARLITEQPLLGGGLGQFRNDYLRVKAPQASEEIADPHNFLLDVWFHGGILAATGVLWLVVSMVFGVRKAVQEDAQSMDSEPWLVPADSRFLLWASAAPWAAFALQYGISGAWDDRLLVVGAAMIGIAVLIDFQQLVWPVSSRTTCGFAALVLFTHLLGAGGIGYTAVMQFLLLCLVGTFSACQTPSPQPVSRLAVWVSCGFFVAAALVALAVWTTSARGLVESADELVRKGTSPEAIRSAYTVAMNADVWDPIPCARMAEFEIRQWETERLRQTSTSERTETLVAAGRALDAAKQRDPENGQWWHRHGTLLLEWAQQNSSPEIARQAVDQLAEAVARYPTNAAWQADLSDAAADAGEFPLAIETARKALAQDDVNQRFGHVERILAADVRTRLERRAETGDGR